MVHVVVVVTTLFLLTSCISAQEQVMMTILSIGHLNSEADGEYQCHLSNPDNRFSTTVTSFRAVDTRNDGNNPGPPDTVYQPRNTYQHYKVTLNANGNDWFGVFGCEAVSTINGKIETRISTTRMRSDADFTPANELFTQTVSIGDMNVAITMDTTRNTNGIRWRKDSMTTSQSRNGTFFIPGPIQLSDAGTYECQFQGERDMAKQGLNLLLVRACPATRWGPPDCVDVCDSCYNGGICDENNGKCVCPPGFMGDNCLQACGGNRYGHTCEKQCSSRDLQERCGTYLFCLVHPFGCRCNTGWKGLTCDTACQGNTFGASCLQSCHHCASNQCNRYTGRCTGSDTRCEPGWIGDSCQECDGNYFGMDCSQECRCAKENCNRESGLCKPGACLPRWVDLYPPHSCQTGLENITYTKVNFGIPVPVTCQAVQGPEGDLSSLQLVLSKDSERLEDDDITAGDRSRDGATGSFMVTNVQTGDMLYCQLRDGSGKLAVLSISVEVFDLPVLPSTPVDISVNGSSVTISWSAWDENTDIGDSPLIGYVPHYKVREENDWISSEMVSPQTLVHTFTSLNPETTYAFSVSAVRPGEGGEGPRSPELRVRTLCDVPPNPENVMADISGENQENIKVSWQLPSEGISCSSGVIKFTVYYLWGTNLTSVDVTDPSATSIILSGVSPGVSYTLYVTLSTSGGVSAKSDEIRHFVPVLPSLTNPPILQDITCNSVTMVWARWTAGQDPGTPPITHYIPYYRMNVIMEWIGGENVSHTSGDEEYSITFYNLTEDAAYNFTVVPVREGYGGKGRVTNVVHGSTICLVLPSLTNPPTLQDITCNSVTMVWARWTAGQDPGTPPITHYIPYYRMNVSMEWISGENVSHTSGDEEYSITFYNLTEDASYDFTVVPVREGYGGEGRVTNVVYGNTTICLEDGGGGSSALTIAVTASLSVLVILLIIVAIVMIFRRRDKKKPLTTDYEISGATSNSYVKDINEPETVFSKNVEQTEEEDEALYANLEKPVSIKIADLEKYIRDCESSSTGKLEQQFKLLNGDRQFASHVGDKEQNKTKNRFKNMVAYDHSRVVLEMTDGDPHSDYYNANYIKNAESEVAFIASQGPNRASVVDFWRMVWKENVCNIVMLTNLIEDGKDRCIQYWPPTVGASKRFGEIKLTWESDEQFGDYNIRQLQVKLGEDIRTVTNWHFKAWPDKDVPDQPSPLIEFARRVKSYQKTAPGHLLVHCSAGVGRTGTFIALYTLMDVIETETKIDIYGYVERMRQDRIKMVQTEIQYKFLHECLLEIYLTGNTKIPVKNMESFDVQAEKENLKRQFKILAKLDKRCASPHAATLEESEKSRYPKIVPVNKRRPFLQTPGKSSYSNYINACFVTTYRKKDAFIATQSPLPNTVEDFWRLIYDWKCPLIVMLNQLDPRDQTCCKYWPENDSSQYGNMNVTLKEEHNVGIYVHRQFEVIDTFNQEPRVVHHMQLNSWNDRNQQNITILIREMEKMQQDYSMVAPAVVHCINGVGRTGVFLTIKSEMERMSAEGNVDVFHTVRQLRGSNHCMVYTEEDYYLCHQLLKLEFPESHYANI